jgi:hypothetical protein
MLVIIKLSGAVVFVAAVLVGVGVLTGDILFYYLAIALSAAAFLAVILSSLRWRRPPSRYS